MTTPKKDLIWIELPKPDDAAHAARICEKANRMMARLGDTAGKEFFWDEHHHCYAWGGDMGYHTLSDRGEWFNLDCLGREPEPKDTFLLDELLKLVEPQEEGEGDDTVHVSKILNILHKYAATKEKKE